MALQAVKHERRQFGRRPSHIEAQIAIPGHPLYACTVVNHSDGGALVSTDQPVPSTASFRLSIDGTPFNLLCEVRHRSGGMIGVRFVRAAEGAALSRHLQKPATETTSEDRQPLPAVTQPRGARPATVASVRDLRRSILGRPGGSPAEGASAPAQPDTASPSLAPPASPAPEPAPEPATALAQSPSNVAPSNDPAPSNAPPTVAEGEAAPVEAALASVAGPEHEAAAPSPVAPATPGALTVPTSPPLGCGPEVPALPEATGVAMPLPPSFRTAQIVAAVAAALSGVDQVAQDDVAVEPSRDPAAPVAHSAEPDHSAQPVDLPVDLPVAEAPAMWTAAA